MTITMRLDPSVLQYRVDIRPEPAADGSVVYMAEIPELPGCMSHGVTIEEARQNLEDAKREYLAALEERSLPIPSPSPRLSVGMITWTVATADFTSAAEESAPVVRLKSRTEVLEPG
jgi:predicted RNase H-like HicB family nuclease